MTARVRRRLAGGARGVGDRLPDIKRLIASAGTTLTAGARRAAATSRSMLLAAGATGARLAARGKTLALAAASKTRKVTATGPAGARGDATVLVRPASPRLRSFGARAAASLGVAALGFPLAASMFFGSPVEGDRAPEASLSRSAGGDQLSGTLAPPLDRSPRVEAQAPPAQARVPATSPAAPDVPVRTAGEAMEVPEPVNIERAAAPRQAPPTSKTSVRREPARTPRTAAAPNRSSASPQKPKYFGSLTINSEPRGAVVVVDGRQVGLTPLTLESVPAGSRVIRIESDGYERWSTAARVVANRQTSIVATLQRSSNQ